MAKDAARKLPPGQSSSQTLFPQPFFPPSSHLTPLPQCSASPYARSSTLQRQARLLERHASCAACSLCLRFARASFPIHPRFIGLSSAPTLFFHPWLQRGRKTLGRRTSLLQDSEFQASGVRERSSVGAKLWLAEPGAPFGLSPLYFPRGDKKRYFLFDRSHSPAICHEAEAAFPAPPSSRS